eukprot:11208167-Lingulodinium_polyedra.AAC.1
MPRTKRAQAARARDGSSGLEQTPSTQTTARPPSRGGGRGTRSPPPRRHAPVPQSALEPRQRRPAQGRL